jgi:hypothetical protein
MAKTVCVPVGQNPNNKPPAAEDDSSSFSSYEVSSEVSVAHRLEQLRQEGDAILKAAVAAADPLVYVDPASPAISCVSLLSIKEKQQAAANGYQTNEEKTSSSARRFFSAGERPPSPTIAQILAAIDEPCSPAFAPATPEVGPMDKSLASTKSYPVAAAEAVDTPEEESSVSSSSSEKPYCGCTYSRHWGAISVCSNCRWMLNNNKRLPEWSKMVKGYEEQESPQKRPKPAAGNAHQVTSPSKPSLLKLDLTKDPVETIVID